MDDIAAFRPAAEIRALTAKLIAAQPSVPVSPGALIDEAPLLCLAACAAEAGMLARGETAAAAAFRNEAARAGDKSVLFAAFDRLGWPRAACDAALKFNDSQSPALRKERILELLAND